MPPRSLTEWQQHINGLSSEALKHELQSANTWGFVRTLQQEGYSAVDMQAIVQQYAKQAVTQQLQLPVGGPYDLAELAQS